ncbi:LRR and PYD domains-containing 3-like protein [Labeo rohita]|uniref:LRR and PYD domains-containing 3-like protein n=1 Tax=Labeo rohita TaxID=84645 RepID=A0A498MK12_LABRO|nr:LRR and PYD domains-containing 3-like protein [Labeo rohita]
MVCQYKKSVDWKDLNERSFPSGERVSLAALYTEPVIIQKNKKGSFLNVSVEELFSKSNLCLYYPTIILQGNPGSGKSVIAQKILLDWASEKPYLEDFDLTFCLRYEEVKCISEEMNLIELLSWSCSLTSSQISRMVLNSVQRVLLIIDGLDEPDELRFICDEFCISSKFQRASPEVIVCSLLRQQILPRSVLLITTRTKFPHGMLLEGQQRFFRIVGFSEKEVEEYFHKFFQNEELFRKVYEFVRKNETLITACSIPVMCWIICMVLRERFCEGAHVTSGLETTTSIYVDFVSTLLEHHCQGLSQSVLTLLRSLGQLAERGMLEQQVLFDEKTVSETMSDPFLCKRKISQEMMFSFMHHSFQEFFTALYYVLLDEEESKRKVRELLRTVEKGWALSCWSDREANLEISKSKLLQPVILFVCGLCKKECVSSFFEKHNMAVSVNVETQLKEWLNQCSQRYQNEHMLFILHCLYELHEKSFTGKVLEQLVSMDLSNVQLENAHRWMLWFCFQNCVNIGKLRLSITCDNLKILRSTPYRCEELW